MINQIEHPEWFWSSNSNSSAIRHARIGGAIELRAMKVNMDANAHHLKAQGQSELLRKPCAFKCYAFPHNM